MTNRFWAAFAALGVLCTLSVGAETRAVTETVGGQVTRHTEQRSKVAAGGGWIETIVTPKETVARTYDATGSLVSVDWTGAAGTYQLVRQGDRVKASGTFRGKPVAGTIDLKGRLWDRGGGDLDFSVPLQALAKQGFRGNVTLLTIAPDDLGRPVEMSFQKEGTDIIDGRSLVRVRLGLTGALSLLWSGLA